VARVKSGGILWWAVALLHVSTKLQPGLIRCNCPTADGLIVYLGRGFLNTLADMVRLSWSNSRANTSVLLPHISQHDLEASSLLLIEACQRLARQDLENWTCWTVTVRVSVGRVKLDVLNVIGRDQCAPNRPKAADPKEDRAPDQWHCLGR